MNGPEAEIRQTIIDQEHLRLLSIAYWVAAGMNAFFSLFGLMYAFMGAFMTAVIARSPAPPRQDVPPEFIGWIFGILGLGIFLLMVGLGVLKVMVAGRLRERRSRTFCMVVAGISCFGVPYGTILGVLTFLVLTRPTVARSFGASPPPSGTGSVAGAGG